MNLISCDSCGVVLDKNKIVFPDGIWDDNYNLDSDKAVWDSNKRAYIPFVKCPACGEPVKE